MRLFAFIRRDLRIQVSYRLAMIMRFVGMFITIGTFYFVSQVFEQGVSDMVTPYAPDYFHYALLGLAFLPFLTLGVSALSNSLRNYQQTGTLEMLFMSPTPILVSLLMSTVVDLLWALASALIYLILAQLLFGADIYWTGLPGMLLMVALVILSQLGLGMIDAAFVLLTKRGSPMHSVYTLAISLIGGVYFPLEILPSWLRWLGKLLPASYYFDALRRVMLRGASMGEVWRDAGVLVVFTLVLLPAGIYCFGLAVRRAKMDGSLAQY